MKKMIASFLLVALTAAAMPSARPDSVSYSQHAAPLLRKHCLGCHNSTDAEKGLSLQTPAEIRRGGENGSVLNPESFADSKLLKVLLSTGDDHMPPAGEPQLSAEELTLLKNWIENGAVFDGAPADVLSLPSISVTAERVLSPVLSLAIHPDGKSAAFGGYRSISLQQLSDGRQLTRFRVDDGKVTDLRMADGMLLAATGVTGFSGRALLLDPDTGNVRMQYSGATDILYAATRSADGLHVATGGYDRRIRIYSAQSGELLRELTGHNGAIFDLSFSPDGRLLASASADATIKVWNVATGERMDTMSQPLAEQYSVAFSPDGKQLFATGADNRIRRWSILSQNAPAINPLLDARFAHEGTIRVMALSASGKFLATAAEDGTLKVWDTADLSELVVHRCDPEFATALAFDDVGAHVIAGTAGGQLIRYALPTATSSRMPTTAAAAESAGPSTVTGTLVEITEQEPNDEPAGAQAVELPFRISGVIHPQQQEGADTGTKTVATSGATDTDTFLFHAEAGQQLVLEVTAAQNKSPLDSRIEVVDSSGKPVLQTRLQAIRDSYFTFRGKDSETVDDFRMFNWQEMDLNQYLYADGEVMRLWLYPRGPDSGYKVYPGFGKRYTYFGTTATSHPLQGPAFIVVPYGPDEPITENGLPVFPVYAENDDDPLRENGTDSRLMFRAPSAGNYLVRITDARGFSGSDYSYQLTVRSPAPDFRITVEGTKIATHQGTGRELTFTATRIDGFSGPVEIVAHNLPPGFSMSLPTEIELDQKQAVATLMAAADAVQPDAETLKNVKFVARATINGTEVTHELGGLTELTVAEKPKVTLTIHTAAQAAAGNWEHTPELTVYAGELNRAFVRAARTEFTGNIDLGKETAGRNMPHGVFVDNIGLNGLMILENQTEREFFIRVAPWIPETSRTFYLKSGVDGITTLPVMLHVRHRGSEQASAATR
jgi:mono/diheme cytochrome c family protein/sugar lactone lactonase YvrE